MIQYYYFQLFQRAFDEEQVPPPLPQMHEPMLHQPMEQHHQANAVVQNNTVQALMNQVQQLNQTIQNMQIQMNNQQNSRTTPSQGSSQNQNQGGRSEGNGNRDRCPKKKYCWTHGSCDHASRNCNNPALGHQFFATFCNRMGGNNYMCQRANSNNQAQYQNQHQQQPQYQNQQQQQYQDQQSAQQNQRFQAPNFQHQMNNYGNQMNLGPGHT